MRKPILIFAAIVSLAFLAVPAGAQTSTAPPQAAFEVAMQAGLDSANGALWQISNASRGTCGAFGWTPTCNGPTLTYAPQIANAEWDLMQIQWAATRDMMWAEGVNHATDNPADPNDGQAFFSYHTATCGGTTYDADTDPVGAIRCDLKNSEAWLTLATTDLAAVPTNTTSTRFNGYVLAAQRAASGLASEWQAAEAAAAPLANPLSFPAAAYQLALHQSASVTFELGVAGCWVTLTKVSPLGCGHVSALLLQKLVYQPSTAYHVDEIWNVVQNCIFSFTYQAAVQASLLGLPGAQSLDSAVHFELEPKDKMPYRLGTDTPIIAKLLAAENQADPLLLAVDRYDSAAWGGTDSCSWAIYGILWPEVK